MVTTPMTDEQWKKDVEMLANAWNVALDANTRATITRETARHLWRTGTSYKALEKRYPHHVAYISELHNPAPDYVMRRILRERVINAMKEWRLTHDRKR